MTLTRRAIVNGALAVSAVAALPRTIVSAYADGIAAKPIPSSGEILPVIGLGSSRTFNVGMDSQLRDECTAVMAAFFEAGGQLIDSSPMYGSSQPTIGYALKKLGHPKNLFSAEKVWISNSIKGPRQIEQSRNFWGVPKFDLLQVHNLLSWEEHLDTLLTMKAEGKLRYVGITTSHGRRHSELEQILNSRKLDFVQLSYNVLDRDVEARLLPLARELGIAVIVNRPFQRGTLIRRVTQHPLPGWVSETDASSWPQFLLKFIVSHPAVTCAIPATTRVDHVRENMNGGTGVLPDSKLRQRMADYVREL